MKPSIGVIYYWQPFNKINGSLFYAFEYYSLLKELNPDENQVEFYIINCNSNHDKRLVIEAFKSKYKENIVDSNKPKFIKTTLLYRSEKDRYLFLDVNSYNSSYMFIPKQNIEIENCYLYCDNKYNMINSIKYPYNLFGYYPYQKYLFKFDLKINFDIFQEIENGRTKYDTFVSSLNSKFNQIEKYIPKKYKTIIFKTHTKCINIFKQTNNILYIHNGTLDTNNRLIPEAKFYKKNIEIIYTNNYNRLDSIEDRYNRTLNNFSLIKDDLLIQKILGNIK